ncbi:MULTISPECIES: DUF3422 domain-containing protein [unclassified Polaromonas]|jgi:uncharacterized membrane-anchored protein|uniref:DUF3422 family protein n=1 Tax=unclassified Polaromonas TaxID=2638319 RepID=UPI000BD69A96|nr:MULTISPECIES: DUF3422 domain-containing protein [unclassified Polaromonas]OYY38032.1 MAG: hypothetical protein B7Y60_06440 [Polaromonas sp. 35-63-35]OYZ18475.1 MAG: hypothetical protein B7Y28_15625 [Polaromonas sp. 16-63-31]OYZ79579.1 MAG: hypothetical protein B7Y09_08540 [Polaromonas sp. 24-63-21]OZA50727.1 MAG: hypothetical protein B7X88_10760 [Polaromonas sp. 17-63-33]OZA89584.1 MAG: hypothetical protein B7X65_03605 [Polaromonas sp. 39-63-25]
MTSSLPSSAASFAASFALLPPDDAQRAVLHNELHARPSARVRLPALIIYVAVLNAGVTREQECAHLRRLPGQQDLPLDSLQGNFLSLRCEGYLVQWERHTEFTRYAIVQSLPASALLGATEPPLLSAPVVAPGWLPGIPGKTVAAIQLAMVHGDLSGEGALMAQALAWFGGRAVVASQLGNGHSWALTAFHLGVDGFERMLVIAPPVMTDMRAGRISQRLLELETYRLMALRGLPVAKALGPMLAEAEGQLADITARLENKSASDQELLDTLVSLAARVERATAEHSYRFSATRAYSALVGQRIAELREKPISGTQLLGEFMQRRLSPAMATVEATAQRLASLSERVSRTSALLRTRVDIATEVQNQQLLEKLTRGQELQLRLQSTVEGLSIAAISYYVVSLLLYVGKAFKAAGAPINPEIAAGALIPLVLWGVWRTTRRIHEKIRAP